MSVIAICNTGMSLKCVMHICHDACPHLSTGDAQPDARPINIHFSLHAMSLTSPIKVRFFDRNSRGLTLPTQLLHHDTWNALLCARVPVSLLELVQLAVDHLGLVVNMDNSHKMLRCHWKLGWRISSTTNAGITRHLRGRGGNWVETNATDTNSGVVTGRLARVICGLQISKVSRITGLDLPDTTWETEANKEQDTLFFVLVRYAAPHRNSGARRGPKHRPLCPGLLQDTHCLWSWAKRGPAFRRGCLQGNHWNRNKHFFGPDDDSQERRRICEEKAWYDLIQVHDVESYANVQIDPDRDQSFLQSVMWC